MRELNYEFTEDYTADFAHYVDELWAQTKAGDCPREQRIVAVQALTDAYISAAGIRPANEQLTRLGTLLLYEEITDTHPDKMTREEFPIISDSQLEERERREVLLVWAESYGTDGIDYAIPTREYRRKLRSL